MSKIEQPATMIVLPGSLTKASSFGAQSGIEIIDAVEFAKRVGVPDSWVRARTTSPRFLPEQRIPHLRFGRYIRYAWGSPELVDWLRRCMEQ